jgi:hypothetical protein
VLHYAYMKPESHNSFTNPSPQTSRLTEVLGSLEKHIKRQNSLKFVFVRGMIYGLGTVIGATVLVALLGGVLNITGFFNENVLPENANEPILQP